MIIRLASVLIILTAMLAMASCMPPPPVLTVKGACDVFPDPKRVVYGKTRTDQRWISTIQEGGISACGWQRPTEQVVSKGAQAKADANIAPQKKMFR